MAGHRHAPDEDGAASRCVVTVEHHRGIAPLSLSRRPIEVRLRGRAQVRRVIVLTETAGRPVRREALPGFEVALLPVLIGALSKLLRT